MAPSLLSATRASLSFVGRDLVEGVDGRQVIVVCTPGLSGRGLVGAVEAAGHRPAQVHPRDLSALSSLAGLADLVVVDLAVDADEQEVLAAIRRFRAANPGMPVIVVASEETIGRVAGALDAGATGYLKHPVLREEVALALSRGAQGGASADSGRVPSGPRMADLLGQFVGEHPAIVAARDAASRIAGASATPVLFVGEDGTGKHLLARIIHDLSPRSRHPFLVAHCSKASDQLLEAELFGRLAGGDQEPGRVEPGLADQAEGGTLFLDDVTDLPFPLQLRLLRLLEEKRPLSPGGEGGGRPSGLRLMAASTVPLERAVEEGVFHRDLRFRLGVFPIPLPPLRDRRQDILPLARHFIERFNVEFRRRVGALEPEAERRLVGCDWRGNVRELRNAIERAMILETSEVLHAEYLPIEEDTAPPVVGPLSFVQLPSNGVALDAVERELVRQALARVGGNQVRAAGLLGISRDALRNRMKKFKLGSGRRRTR